MVVPAPEIKTTIEAGGESLVTSRPYRHAGYLTYARIPVNPATTPPRLSLAALRFVRWFAYLLALAVVTTLLPLPWSLSGLPAAVAASVVAIVAMVKMRRTASTVLWVMMAVGLLLCGGLALTYAAEAVFYREFEAYQQCRSSAITVGATTACDREFRDAVNARAHRFGISVYPSPSPSASGATSPSAN
jgi:hypothetical protein